MTAPTIEQRRAAMELFTTRHVVPVLLLDHWRLTYRWPERMRNRATCSALPAYKEAKIAYCLSKMDPSEDGATVIHEHLHCHVELLGEVALSLAPKGDKQAAKRIEDAEEGLTTNLEHVLDRFLLPEYEKILASIIAGREP